MGVLENQELSWSESGTTQGSILSPLLGNIYLHHVLDDWFETEVKPRLQGKALLVRYADDFVMGFQREDDAKRVLEVLYKRMAKFGLTLHPEKTKLVPFRRPRKSSQQRKGPGSFDFVGFNFHWRRTRSGNWKLGTKTRRKSSRRFLKNVNLWCRRHRHQPVKEQHRKLTQKLTGHYRYFGVNGNARCLSSVAYQTKRIWGRCLRNRSQKAKKGLPWSTFFDSFLRRHPLPDPKIYIQIWDW